MTSGNIDNVHGHIMPSNVEHDPDGPHILIAEDQPAIQDLLCRTLQLAGYHPLMCTGRQAALTWRREGMIPGDDPVVLLLDLSLLDVTEATDFLHLLRTRWHEAVRVPPPVIVLTTSPQVQAALGIREHVLQKPFHVRELLALIQQVIPVPSPCSQPSL